MPLHRRRESVTAVEIIAALKVRPDYRTDGARKLVAAVDAIELELRQICNRNGIVNDVLKCVGGPNDGEMIEIAGTIEIGQTIGVCHSVVFDPEVTKKPALQMENYIYLDGVLKHAPRR